MLISKLARGGGGGETTVFWNQQNNYGCLRWAGDLDGNVTYLCYLTAISPKFCSTKVEGP